MPLKTLRKKLEAEEAYFAAGTDAERAELSKVVLKAEEDHLAAIEVERASPWKALLGVAIVAATAIVLIASISTARTASDTAGSAGDTAHRVERLVGVLRNVSRQQRSDAVSQCERGNEARAASVQKERDAIRYTLAPSLRLWRAVLTAQGIDPSTPKRVTDSFNDFLEGLQLGIKSAHTGIRKTIEAQADVAVRPGSPRINCRQAFLSSP